MTEPREPIPQENGEFDIDMKRAVLTEALGVFSTKIFANDVLFRAISTTLSQAEQIVNPQQDLRTDFRVTPHVKNGKYSLCLEESARGYAGDIEADNGDVGSTFFKFATAEYVPVCVIMTNPVGKTGVAVDETFAELATGRDFATQKINQDEAVTIETAVRTVLSGIEEIAEYCDQRGVEVVFGEFGRPQLFEEVQNTFNFSE